MLFIPACFFSNAASSGSRIRIFSYSRVDLAIAWSILDVILLTSASNSPFFVLGQPLARDERHALLQLTQQVLQLMVGIHAYRHLTHDLAKGRDESEVISIHVKPLREDEGLVAVDLC